MPTFYDSLLDSLSNWARKKSPGSFSDFMPSGGDSTAATDIDGLIYKLRQWPTLPDSYKTAKVYRVLSVMTQRPVNKPWLLAFSGMKEADLDALLRRLVSRGDVDVIDTSRFAATAVATNASART